METTLGQYLEGRTAKGFRPVPHYFRDGDFVSFFFSNDRCFAQRVDELLTVYLSETTGQMVGCKIKGVRLLLKTLKAFALSIEDDEVRLDWLFLSAGYLSSTSEKGYYEILRERVKDAKVPLNGLAAAA
jgi:hypothetical protein